METPLTPEQLGALHADLHPARVAKRQSGNQQLSYMEAYDVKAMLIRVFGYAGFSADCLDARIIREEQVPQARDSNKLNWKITAQATVRITIPQTGATYTETAIAGNAQPDYTEAADTALKSAESDALKRAAIYLGTQFGLSLYDNGATRDIVRRVFAPFQSMATQLIVQARDEANPAAAQEAAKRLQRLQASLKVHERTDAPEQPDEPAAEQPAQDAQEPAQEPQKPKAAPRSRKAPSAREKAARAALADAEATVGLKVKDRPNFPPPSAFDEQDGEMRDPGADGSER